MVKRYGLFVIAMLVIVAYFVLYQAEQFMLFGLLFIAERFYALFVQPKFDAIMEEELEKDIDNLDKRDMRFLWFLLFFSVFILGGGLYLLLTEPRLLFILLGGEAIDYIGAYLLNGKKQKAVT